MASHVFVVDTAMKRTQIKVSPGKYLREVLEEACKARKLDPESYMLKTQNNKQVDLSQPFRLSGLSAGAKLQLTQASRSAGVVNVALQLPESEGAQRLSDKFPSTTSLWVLLRKFEDGVAGQQAKKLNLTQRGVPSNLSSGSGRLEYESPVLNLMGRSLESLGDLQKTLSQLGVNSGSVLMRLTFKSNGKPLEQAMKEIEQYFSAVDTAPATIGSNTTQAAGGAHAAPNGNMTSVPNTSTENTAVPAEDKTDPGPAELDQDTPMTDVTNASIAQPVEIDVLASSSETQPQPAEPASKALNGISVFRPPSNSTPAAALQGDDPAVFEPSIDHAKAHQAALQRATRNTRLLSDKEIEEQEHERERRLSSVQKVTIRVRYPDQAMTEFVISSGETSADLYGRVMSTLKFAPEPFELRHFGRKGLETLPNSSSQRLVKDLGFGGKMLVTLVWSEGASNAAKSSPSLNEEYWATARDLKVEVQSQQAVGEESHRIAMAKKDTAGPKKSGGVDLETKMKKFLGFGKK